MSHPHQVLAHHHQQKTKKKRGKVSKRLTAFDHTVLVLSCIYPLSGLPQAVAVWHGNGRVAVLSWVLFFAFGLVSLAYGVVHRIMPMIVANVVWSFIDLSIIVGTLR